MLIPIFSFSSDDTRIRATLRGAAVEGDGVILVFYLTLNDIEFYFSIVRWALSGYVGLVVYKLLNTEGLIGRRKVGCIAPFFGDELSIEDAFQSCRYFVRPRTQTIDDHLLIRGDGGRLLDKSSGGIVRYHIGYLLPAFQRIAIVVFFAQGVVQFSIIGASDGNDFYIKNLFLLIHYENRTRFCEGLSTFVFDLAFYIVTSNTNIIKHYVFQAGYILEGS